MQEHSLVGPADRRNVTDLGRLEALDVPERDHGALARGQLLQGLLEAVEGLAPHGDALGGVLGPVMGRAGPAAVGAKPIRVLRALGAMGRAEGGEGGGAILPPGAGPGAVGEDAEDPGLEGGASLEPGQALEHREPGLLHDLVGRRGAGHEGAGEPSQGGIVATDHLDEGGLVSVEQATHEQRLGRRGAGQGRLRGLPTGHASVGGATPSRWVCSTAMPPARAPSPTG